MEKAINDSEELLKAINVDDYHVEEYNTTMVGYGYYHPSFI